MVKFGFCDRCGKLEPLIYSTKLCKCCNNIVNNNICPLIFTCEYDRKSTASYCNSKNWKKCGNPKLDKYREE